MSTGKMPSMSNRSLWRAQLSTALRTAVACGIVGAVTLYSPNAIRRYLKFRAFTYMTAVVIVGEATLGDSLKGAVCALYGSAAGLLPSMLTFYVMRPQEISALTTSIAVAISSFLVVIVDSTGLITKRIALGQIVIVYVTAYQDTRNGKPLLYPFPVAASTLLGVVASLLAMVLPYRRLAYYEVKGKSKLYMELAIERLGLFVNAFSAENSSCMAASLSQAKALSVGCTKLLRVIKLMQDSTLWERRALNILPAPSRLPWDSLQATETILKGMEMTLASTTSISLRIVDLELKDHLINLRDNISLKLSQAKSKSEGEMIDKTILPLLAIPRTLQELPSFFFLFCMKVIYNSDLITPPLKPLQESYNVTPVINGTPNSGKVEKPSTGKRKGLRNWAVNLITKKLIISLKCSLSLGLAVFFGVLFSKDDGYWSGLTVAIAFTPWRKTTFKLASIRAHGTALGSVYGLLGSFISQSHMEARLFSLLPWIIFASFLRRSRMYGEVGGFAATISAMIILGRRDYGSPIIFTIERLTETYIGLCCSIFLEILFQPTMASTTARLQVCDTLQTFYQWIVSPATSVELREKEKELRVRVNKLKDHIQEAEEEPNFWFLPFPTACYNKLHNSLSEMVDLVLFLDHGMELLVQEFHGSEIEEAIKGDLDHFKEIFGASMKFFEDIMCVNSVEELQKELKTSCCDIELGKQPDPHRTGILSADEDDCCKLVASFLQHIEIVMRKLDVNVSGESKNQLVLCTSSIAYCVGELLRKVKKLEKQILALLQWENPSTQINLQEIFYKMKEAYE